MAPRSIHTAAKTSQQHDDEEDAYLKQYLSIFQKNKELREERRSKLQQVHKNRTDALRAEIQALQSHGSDGTFGGNEAMIQRKERLETLRSLLARKNDIEQQIAICAAGLERALSTTSLEVQASLRGRIQKSNEAAASINHG